MRTHFGVGTPRGLQGRLTAALAVVVALWTQVVGFWNDLKTPSADHSSTFMRVIISSCYPSARQKEPFNHGLLAFVGDELVGTLRVLLREPIVWPEIVEEDAIYVYNLAVRRAWADRGLGGCMLEWAGGRAASLGRKYVRLDCVTDNDFLRDYYTQAGFEERGEIEARFPPPVGAMRLRRYEQRI